MPAPASPVGNPTQITRTAAELAAALTIEDQLTILTIAPALTAGLNLLVSAGLGLRPGAMLIVNWLSDTTARAVTGTTGFLAGTPAAAGTISKQSSATYWYDGTVFRLMATVASIN